MSNTITTYRAKFPGDELFQLGVKGEHPSSTKPKDLNSRFSHKQISKLLDFAYLYLKWDIRRVKEAEVFKQECFPERNRPLSMPFPTEEVIALSNSRINPDISDPILFFIHNALYKVNEDEANYLFANFEKSVRLRLEHLDENKKTVHVSDSLHRRMNKCLVNLLQFQLSLSDEDKARYLMELDRLLNAINENLPISKYGLEILHEDLNHQSTFCEKVSHYNEGAINIDRPERFWESPPIPQKFLTAARKISYSGF